MESHPINGKVLLNLFLCEGLWLWKKVLWGWRVQGSMDCCNASLDVQKAWNSHSALANPNVCSTLLFPLTPWAPFTSTAVALQRSSSTTISTRLLNGICCRLSRPWKTLVTLTWKRLLTVVREIIQESVHCPSDWGIWLSWCLGFAGAPAAHSSELSHFPGRATTLTIPTLPSELELGRHCHI